jgi:hypothetical protein
MKVCYGPDEAEARATAHRLWANDGLPGELAQLLPTPTHFEQACQLVDEDTVAASIPCGPDLATHVELIERYEAAGFDEVYVQQVGEDQGGFFAAYERDILPRWAT